MGTVILAQQVLRDIEALSHRRKRNRTNPQISQI
jgi:hypothetical protein